MKKKQFTDTKIRELREVFFCGNRGGIIIIIIITPILIAAIILIAIITVPRAAHRHPDAASSRRLQRARRRRRRMPRLLCHTRSVRGVRWSGSRGPRILAGEEVLKVCLQSSCCSSLRVLLRFPLCHLNI